jgi:hypothetical protein
MLLNNNVNYKLSGHVRMVVNENDKIVRDTGYFNNLILNSGMEQVSVMPFSELFCTCVIGNGTADTKKTNAPDTSSYTSGNGYDVNLLWSKSKRVNNLITFPSLIKPGGGFYNLTGSIISTSDVGNIIKIDNDGFYRISERNGIDAKRSCSILNLDGTAPTGTSSGSNYTIYFTNQVSMSAELRRAGNATNGVSATGGSVGINCNSAIYNSTITHIRDFSFPFSTDQTVPIRELGFTWNVFNNSVPLFSRVRLTEGPKGNSIIIKAGQNLTVYYSLRIDMEPTTSTTKYVILGNNNITGSLQMNLYGLSKVTSTGRSSYMDDGLHGNEPYFNSNIGVYGLPSSNYNKLYIYTSSDSSPNPNWGTNIVRSGSFVSKSIDKTSVFKSVSPTSSYGYTSYKVATFNDVESINSNWKSFGIGIQNNKTLMSYIFNSAQNKSNGYLLSISQSFTWNRNFT